MISSPKTIKIQITAHEDASGQVFAAWLAEQLDVAGLPVHIEFFDVNTSFTDAKNLACDTFADWRDNDYEFLIEERIEQ